MSAQDVFGGRTAVITGASSGIGAGLARHAAGLGMKLVLADIAAERLADIAAELRATGAEVEAVVTDVADPASVDALADHAYTLPQTSSGRCPQARSTYWSTTQGSWPWATPGRSRPSSP